MIERKLFGLEKKWAFKTQERNGGALSRRRYGQKAKWSAPSFANSTHLPVLASEDGICPKDDTEDLWQSGGQPDIWRLPHGHVGVCRGFALDLLERVLSWLTPRLNAPAAHAHSHRVLGGSSSPWV
jgi:hypothetical protein